MKKNTDKDIQDNFEEKWKFLELSDGSINKEQLKLELMDFSDMINRMTKLTVIVTHGRMSYPTYDVDAIVEVMNEVEEEDIENQKKDDKEDGVCSLCKRDFK